MAVMERKRSLLRQALEEFQKQIFQEITKLEERLSGEEVAFLEKKQSLQRMCKDRRYAEMEERTEKFAAKGDVTRTAASGSPISDVEAGLMSVEVND